MGVEVGAIIEGKVTGITKFGAFVALEGGKSGLVHISEVANSFVTDVNEFVQLGQTVKVKVLGISPEGKINLSIRQAADRPAPPRESAPRRSAPPRREASPRAAVPQADPPSSDQLFEDRLKKFMQESDSRIADNRLYAEHNRRGRRR